MPGWRVGFCVGNRALVGALTNIKGYLDYGSFAPVQLAAATALTSCDGDVAENRAVYKHRAKLLCTELEAVGLVGPATGGVDVRLGAPAGPGRHLGSVKFASELLERAAGRGVAGRRVRPGGEGYVRFALIENDDRTRRACAAIGEFLARSSTPRSATRRTLTKPRGSSRNRVPSWPLQLSHHRPTFQAKEHVRALVVHRRRRGPDPRPRRHQDRRRPARQAPPDVHGPRRRRRLRRRDQRRRRSS